MKFGVAVSVGQRISAKAAGFEFVEETVPRILQSDELSDQTLSVLAANQLLPDSMKIAGPDVATGPLRVFVHRLCERAEQIGLKTLVFDAGIARSVPEDFDRKQAKRQILEFLRTTLTFCARYGIMLVCQPLEPTHSNMINTLPEAMQYVWEVDHPNFQCLFDGQHFLATQEPIENLRDALHWIRHVHLPSRSYDLRSLLAELKRAQYDELITLMPSEPDELPGDTVEILKKQWFEA